MEKGNVTAKKKTSERLAGIDLIKILAMLLVTLLHVTGVGGAVDTADNPVTKAVLSSFEGISFCCINLFALSTGFLYYGKKAKYSKLIQLWLQVVFWAVIGNIIPALYFRDFSLMLQSPFTRIFVISFKTYWYLDAYFALFFFIPLFNSAIEKITKKQFTAFLIITSFAFGVMPFLFNNDLFTFQSGYSFAWLAYLFFVGAGFRKFDFVANIKASYLTVTAIIAAAVESLFTFFSATTEMTFFSFDYSKVYGNYNFIAVLLLSFALFLLLAKINIKNQSIQKAAKIFSAAAFSVYLIQCNAAVWNCFFVDKLGFIGTHSPIVSAAMALGLSAAIYFCFSVLGILQNKLFDLLKIRKLCDSVENLFRKLFNSFYGKIFPKCIKN